MQEHPERKETATMPDQRQRPRFLEGQKVINACRTWDAPYKALLVQAFQAGCELRRTGTHHVMVSNDLGMTATIANGGNRRGNKSLRKYQIDTEKLIEGQKMADTAASTEVTGIAAGTPEVTGAVPEPAKIGPGYPAHEFICDLHDGAPLKYRTQEQLDEHRQASHWQCPQCQKWIRTKIGAGGHTSIMHGQKKNTPWTHKKDYKGPATNGAKPTPPRMATAATPSSLTAVATGPVGISLPPDDPRDLAVAMLMKVRAALGDDPRIAALEVERDAWKKRAEDAEAQISMMKALADQMRQAAEL